MEMKFNFDTDFFENLIQGESAVTDIYFDYNIPYVGDFRLKAFDSKYFIDGVTYFRPFIRGFLVLLMAFYNIKQILSFIRQDAGVAQGKAEDIEIGVKGGRYK